MEIHQGRSPLSFTFLGPRTLPERSACSPPSWEKTVSLLLSEYANGSFKSRRKMCKRWGQMIPGRRKTNGQ